MGPEISKWKSFEDGKFCSVFFCNWRSPDQNSVSENKNCDMCLRICGWAKRKILTEVSSGALKGRDAVALEC